ncbi:hypothetical protein RchiOBHm_Chr7g0194631 [Rosa chinensis]|uniref:Putative plant transposon protein domain-containing protein n=1 Tax=Rosa chinensis TaxID=74649 RepID=A0A2P6P675_ROSCH|nr:hypothetical protein RchiOBHm_Chr7g0194631 [Rosa chinensis]
MLNVLPTPNLTVIREFYACCSPNMHAQVDLVNAATLIGCNVEIRGVSVPFTATTIREILGLIAPVSEMSTVDKELAALFVDSVVAETYADRPDATPEELSAGALSELCRLLGHLVRTLLYPSTQSSKITLEEARLIYVLNAKGPYLPFEHYMYTAIRRAAVKGRRHKKAALVFPSVITAVCKAKGVVFEDSDEMAPPLNVF